MNKLLIENKGSLMTVGDTCLGYLIDFDGKGVFEPSYGKIDVTAEEAKKHNAELDNAMLKGMDENCMVGQYGTFYFVNSKVQTFMGTIVSDKVHISPSKRGITFLRSGKQYRGTLQKNADCFNFKRIS